MDDVKESKNTFCIGTVDNTFVPITTVKRFTLVPITTVEWFTSLSGGGVKNKKNFKSWQVKNHMIGKATVDTVEPSNACCNESNNSETPSAQNDYVEKTIKLKHLVRFFHIDNHQAPLEAQPEQLNNWENIEAIQLSHLPVNHHSTGSLRNILDKFKGVETNCDVIKDWILYVVPFQLSENTPNTPNTSNTNDTFDKVQSLNVDRVRLAKMNITRHAMPLFHTHGTIHTDFDVDNPDPTKSFFSVVDGLHRATYLWWLINCSSHSHVHHENVNDIEMSIRIFVNKPGENAYEFCQRMKSLSFSRLKITENLNTHTVGDKFTNLPALSHEQFSTLYEILIQKFNHNNSKKTPTPKLARRLVIQNSGQEFDIAFRKYGMADKLKDNMDSPYHRKMTQMLNTIKYEEGGKKYLEALEYCANYLKKCLVVQRDSCIHEKLKVFLDTFPPTVANIYICEFES